MFYSPFTLRRLSAPLNSTRGSGECRPIQVKFILFRVVFFVHGLVKLLSQARTFTWKMAVYVTRHRCPVILNRAVLRSGYRSLKKVSRLLMRPLKWRILQLLILSRSIFCTEWWLSWGLLWLTTHNLLKKARWQKGRQQRCGTQKRLAQFEKEVIPPRCLKRTCVITLIGGCAAACKWQH